MRCAFLNDVFDFGFSGSLFCVAFEDFKDALACLFICTAYSHHSIN